MKNKSWLRAVLENIRRGQFSIFTVAADCNAGPDDDVKWWEGNCCIEIDDPEVKTAVAQLLKGYFLRKLKGKGGVR